MEWAKDLDKVPDKTGVYIFYNSSGEVIYVGKSTSLKKRLINYKNDKNITFPKDLALRKNISSFDYIVTSNPEEALLLESNLIKKYKPKFNVRLKDDKSYPYLKIVMDDYPYVIITRKLKKDNSIYFGPYVDVKSLRTVIKLGKRLFKIRKCEKKLPSKKCIYYDLNECSAPCINKISKEDYSKSINDFILFIKSDYKKLKESLFEKMKEEAKLLNFEKAASIREAIKSIDKVFYKQRVIAPLDISFDIVYLYKENGHSLIEYLEVREGRLVFEKAFEIVGEGTDEELITYFISEYYSKKVDIENKILVNFNTRNLKEILIFLKEKFKKDVSIMNAKNKFEKDLLKLAEENAKENMKKLFLNKELDTLKKIKEIFNLKKLPIYIEGYDISNISGKYAVGSLVVFYNGKEKKEFYRKFNIKLISKPDDYGMLREVFIRRFLHKNDKDFPWEPDLILIDGGKGQLNVAKKVKLELNLDYKFVSIAKEDEILYFEDFEDGVSLPKNSDVLKLFQRIRDEAHRFAKISYQKRHKKDIINY